MKTIIPFGDRILCKRKEIGKTIGKAGIIVTSQKTEERTTDIAKVVYIPDITDVDKELISSSKDIITSLGKKAKEGKAEAIDALRSLNDYYKLKNIKVGDQIFLTRYTGVDFEETDNPGTMLTMVRLDDIQGVIVENA